jgi:hypothetical protein
MVADERNGRFARHSRRDDERCLKRVHGGRSQSALDKTSANYSRHRFRSYSRPL